MNQVQQTLNQKRNKFFIAFSLLFVLIVTVILYLLKVEYYYYLLGFLVAILTHIIMLVQNNFTFKHLKMDSRFNEIEESERTYGIYNPSGRRKKKKGNKSSFKPSLNALLWYLLKGVVIIAFTIIIVAIEDLYNNPNAIRIIFIYVFGYLTLKVIFIASILIIKERG